MEQAMPDEITEDTEDIERDEPTDDQLQELQRVLKRVKKGFNEFLAAPNARARRAAFDFLREETNKFEEFMD